jgi:transposase InsO family protein
MHRLEHEDKVYCISILENYSRAILASAVTRRQDLEAYVAVLYAAIRKHGCPEVLVSDSGSVFLDHNARQIYKALGIEKQEIEKRQSWQNYIETMLYVIWNSPSWYNSNNGMVLL